MFTEKPPDLRNAQLAMIDCRRTGNRATALWWMRVAESCRRRAATPDILYDDEPGVWWDRKPTRYVNG